LGEVDFIPLERDFSPFFIKSSSHNLHLTNTARSDDDLIAVAAEIMPYIKKTE